MYTCSNGGRTHLGNCFESCFHDILVLILIINLFILFQYREFHMSARHVRVSCFRKKKYVFLYMQQESFSTKDTPVPLYTY